MVSGGRVNWGFADALGRVLGIEKDQSFALLEVQRNAELESLNIKKQSILSKLEIVKKGSEEEKTLRNELSLCEIDIEKSRDEKILSLQELVVNKTIELQQSIADNLGKAFGEAWDNLWAKYEEGLEKQSELDKDRLNTKLSLIEDEKDAGVLSDKEYQQQKEAVNDQIQASDEKLANDKKKLERDKFLMEQAYALGQVIFNTAMGVTFYGANPITAPLIPWVIANGAAQTALIVAQSLPYFKDGGEMTYDGKAIVGDGGKRELVVNPDGSMYVTPNTPTVVDMEKGTIIHPDADKYMSQVQSIIMQNQSISTKAMEEKLDLLLYAVKNRKNKPSLFDMINFAKNNGYGKLN